jgi:hypothetical protein
MNFNGKLKAEVAKAIRNSTKRKLSKYDFIQVFLEGWQCTALGSVISSSFERAGMYPFNFEHLRRHFSNISIAEYFEEHQIVSNPIIEEPEDEANDTQAPTHPHHLGASNSVFPNAVIVPNASNVVIPPNAPNVVIAPNASNASNDVIPNVFQCYGCSQCFQCCYSSQCFQCCYSS